MEYKHWLGVLGATLGISGAAIVNISIKEPALRKPWYHAIAGLATAYAFYKIPDLEKWALDFNARVMHRWERKRLREADISRQFLSSLESSENILGEKFQLVEDIASRRK